MCRPFVRGSDLEAAIIDAENRSNKPTVTADTRRTPSPAWGRESHRRPTRIFATSR
jgi:hypothetical protein